VLGLDKAHRREVDARDLQLRGRLRAVVGGVGVGSGEMVGEHDRLLPQRSDEAVDLPAMLGALAHDVDVLLVERAHRVVDDDPPLDRQPGPRCELDVRPDPRRGHDHVARELGPVAELQPADAAVIADHDAGRARLEMDVHADVLDAPAEDRAGLAVELHVHQPRGPVDDMHLESPLEQAPGGLQAEQTAADHRGSSRVPCPAEHLLGVGDAPKPEDARPGSPVVVEQAGDRREERPAAGRDDQLVVAMDRPVIGRHLPGEAVDPGHPDARVEGDRVLLVPGERVQEDRIRVLETGEDV